MLQPKSINIFDDFFFSAQLQSAPWSDLLLQSINQKTNQIRTFLLNTLLPTDRENRQLWERVFDPQLWYIQQPLRTLENIGTNQEEKRNENIDLTGRMALKGLMSDEKSTAPDIGVLPGYTLQENGNHFSTNGYDLFRNSEGGTLQNAGLTGDFTDENGRLEVENENRNEGAGRNEFGVPKIGRFPAKNGRDDVVQPNGERLGSNIGRFDDVNQRFGDEGGFDYFRETDLRRRSNQCLQGLLVDCSVSEECWRLMMEQAGGYSLAHQTLYFILAKQVSCRILGWKKM